MLEMECFAIAARLHVVMRRIVGRVTDVDWMVRNREYAREVVRVARLQTDAELLALADKFETALDQVRAPDATTRRANEAARAAADAREGAAAAAPVTHEIPAIPRYVGRLR
ncbi:MAG TPA: hypothetical protein VIN75_03030 [Burkholderiaceae bacterium]